MATGFKSGGRQKGSENKMSVGAKYAVQEVFEKLGGVTGMYEWAKTAKDDFYKSIYPKLIALTVGGDPENPLVIHEIRRTIVDSRHPDTKGT